jgi:EAL domain-containing protein (putative c-di-GMP-specific phosphodiesterase class I)
MHADLADAYSAWITRAICGPSGSGEATRCRRIGIEAYRAQITNSSLVTNLEAALRDQEISPDLVDIRLDAGLLLDGTDHRLRAGLQQLTDLGVRLTAINIDGDVLPLDAMTKVPLSSVEFAPMMPLIVGRCKKSETKFKALIHFMNSLGLETRSIGVASERQCAFLKNAGCKDISGPVVKTRMSEPKKFPTE